MEAQMSRAKFGLSPSPDSVGRRPIVDRLLSIFGVLASVVCLGVATTLKQGGFDWNREFISTLIRGPAGPARNLADVGALLFCLSMAFVFVRLSRAPEFSKHAKVIQIGGIGSMVYSAFTITPLHDVVVTVSLVFMLAAHVAMLRCLHLWRETRFFVAGCICLAILIASATVYYTSAFVVILPWAQRITFSLLAIWWICLDWRFPRVRVE